MRAIREGARLSQRELAQSLSLHRTYVGAVERGERNLSLQTLERLAHGLGVDPVELLATDGDFGSIATEG
jgi:transcriptional regulator with XRE-family HTH domain